MLQTNSITTVVGIAVVLCLLITGCSTTGTSEEIRVAKGKGSQESANNSYPELGVKVDRPEHIIAADFVNAISQVEGLGPGEGIIALPPARSGFDTSIEEVLVNYGYRIARVKNRSGPSVLMTSFIEESKAQQGTNMTYMIAIDRIAMKRTYHIDGQVVAPITSLFVRGVSPRLIELNDEPFVSVEDEP